MVATPERRTHCIRIEPVNGDVIRLVLAYSDDLVMSNGAVYKGGIYAQPTGINSTLSGGATVIDFGSVYDTDTITRDQIQSGYWDGAKIFSFFTDWAFPVEDEEEDRVYTFGKMREEDSRFVVEMMSQKDEMNKVFGDLMAATCPYTLADHHVDGTLIASDWSRCKLNHLPIIYTAVVTGVINKTEIVAALLAGWPNDYFGAGELIFKTGLNAGSSFKLVKDSFNNGRIVLGQSFYYPINIGDEFDIMAGCRKRFKEDCVAKWSNGKQNGGYPHVPQRSSVIKFGDQ